MRRAAETKVATALPLLRVFSDRIESCISEDCVAVETARCAMGCL